MSCPAFNLGTSSQEPDKRKGLYEVSREVRKFDDENDSLPVVCFYPYNGAVISGVIQYQIPLAINSLIISGGVSCFGHGTLMNSSWALCPDNILMNLANEINIATDNLAPNLDTENIRDFSVMTCNRFSFSDQIIQALETETMEDGYNHPCEDMLKFQINQNPQEVEEWLQGMILNYRKASVVSDLVKCLGRMPGDLVKDWGLNLARIALAHADLGVRDEAIQALERWDIPEGINLLENHAEPVDWLREYMSQVILQYHVDQF